MASTAVKERLKKIKDLKCYLNSVESKMRLITSELNWSYDKLAEGQTDIPTVTCSIRPEHKVHASRINEHEERCKWLRMGYHKFDTPFPESFGHNSSITFTEELQESVIRNAFSNPDNICGQISSRGVPQTSARLDQDFSREEKLALYDYVITNTKSQKIYSDITNFATGVRESDDKNKIMTPLEIAAAERDAKRRRASYRNKVHTNRKTQTEVLREVIESQMEMLREEMSYQSGTATGDTRIAHDRNESKTNHRRKSHSSPHRRDHSEEHSSTRLHKSYYDYTEDYDDGDRRSKHRSSREMQYKHERGSRHSKHKKEKKHRSRSKSKDGHKHKKSYCDYSGGSHKVK